ncbi:unnamed protein product [Gadus morhua 'NCC']
MDTVSGLDPGLTMEPEDKSLDPRETSHRRFAVKSCNIVFLIFGLLSILLISLQFSSVMHTEEEKEAPSITEFNSSTHVLPVGQTARYTCHTGGTPEPTVEWLHNGRPLERNGTDDQSEAWVERGFLFVRGGRYGVNTVCCMASNSAGTANHTAELLVFDACELTLDPNTAHRELSLSEDNRKVTRVGEDQSVGVYLDRPAGTLSFYRVSPGGAGSSDTLTHIHTFGSFFTQEDLLPGFGFWGDEGMVSSVIHNFIKVPTTAEAIGIEPREINGVPINNFLLGDPAYPLMDWLMKGYIHSPNITPQESFNVYLSSARTTVEISFGD